MAIDLENDILDKVYNSHIIGDENKDNLNPKREVKFTQDTHLQKVLESSEFSGALFQAEEYFKNIKAREPEDFNEVIQAVLEDAVISPGGADPTKKLVDAKKLGLDSLDAPILALAGISSTVAPSAADALLKDIAEQIVKLTIYKNKPKPGKPDNPKPPTEPTTPTRDGRQLFPLSERGPSITVYPGQLIYLRIHDADGPTLDLPKGWVWNEDGYWEFGPSPGPIPGPLPPGVKVYVWIDGKGPTELEVPSSSSSSSSESSSGSSSSSSSESSSSASESSSSSSSSSSLSSESSSSSSSSSSDDEEDAYDEDADDEDPPPPPPPPPPLTPDPKGPTIEDFLDISCEGTISLIINDEFGKNNSEYHIGKINSYSSETNNGDNEGNGDLTQDNRNKFDKLFMNEDGSCIEYELTILKVLLVIVKIIKIVAAMIDPVGMIASELARVICLASSAWHNPPTIAEIISFVMGKIEAILVKVIGWLLNLLYGLAPSMFCAINASADIIKQIKEAILAVGMVGTEINSLASSFASVNKQTHKGISDMLTETLDMCTEMLNGLNPDRLTEGGKSFKELWATTKEASKEAGLDMTSGSALAMTAHNLMKDGAGEASTEVQETYDKAVEAVKAIQEMKSAVNSLTSAWSGTFSQSGAFAQVGALFTKRTTDSWKDWEDVTESWNDFTTSISDQGKAWAAGAKPLATAIQSNELTQVQVKDEYDDPREVKNPDGSTTTEHKKVWQMEEYQNATKELKNSKEYKNASRTEQINMMNKLSKEYNSKYGS